MLVVAHVVWLQRSNFWTGAIIAKHLRQKKIMARSCHLQQPFALSVTWVLVVLMLFHSAAGSLRPLNRTLLGGFSNHVLVLL